MMHDRFLISLVILRTDTISYSFVYEASTPGI